MPETQGQPHQTPWLEDVSLPEISPLSADLTADVCIIGAGIAGLTTAYCLSREGINVIVVEAGQIGNGETGRTTAHLSNAIDDRFVTLEQMHGVENTRLIAESHTAAIERIERIVREENLDCDFMRLDGYLFVPPGESTDLLDQEFDAARRAGLHAVSMLARAPLNGFNTGKTLMFPAQAQFHPMKYLAGLHRAIIHRGGRIFTGSPVTEVHGGLDAFVKTSNNWTVRADAIVVATNAPLVSRLAIASRQSSYRTYVIAAAVPGASVPQGLFWDTAEPYHYARVVRRPGTDLLIIGGEDHKTGQADDSNERWNRLEVWARERFESIRAVEFAWSGQVLEPVDRLAFIGRNPLDERNVFIATGDSGQGLTHGTIAGMLLTDLILHRPNPWTDIYNPSRLGIKAGIGRFAGENLSSATRYGAWVAHGDVDSEEYIERDSGAVVSHGLRKVAAYRDQAGNIYERSAVCTHLGCIVNWNSGEKTWDCPCHGSRFDRYGAVINGPATQNLDAVEPAIEEQPRKIA
jgi:glycine/D-amino acid oxidase-like deaminating enzyme/nitrite reductase/ring-hydroxylating ferredoxin subunit